MPQTKKTYSSASSVNIFLRAPAAFALAAAVLLAAFTLQMLAQNVSRSAAVTTSAGRSSERKTERSRRSRARFAPQSLNYKPVSSTSPTQGVPEKGAMGVQETTAMIMARQEAQEGLTKPPRLLLEREYPDRRGLPQAPGARALSTWPVNPDVRAQPVTKATSGESPAAPQVPGTPFTGPTLADTGAFPPDTMGTAGPTQFVVHVNGRIRTFNKSTGVADGVINADPDVFFASVMTPPPGGGLNFTTDPNVRYDRLTSRWFLTMIDVPSTSPGSIADLPNRVLIAVSDAVSNGVLSGTTVWTYFFIQQDTVGGPSTGEFLDYPSLGIDNNALYIGGNMFDAASGNGIGTSAFVVQKASVLAAGPIVTTAFRGIVVGAGDGPFAPRGVDNYSTTANEGYFIGISNAAFARVNMRRIATPGAVPTISADIPINTPLTTTFPESVQHLGNTGGTSGRLDALDDRLFEAHIRNGKLWTAHNIEVNATGTASGSGSRDAVRWYEITVPVNTGTPTFVESGTVFDPAAANPQYYFIPSVMVSGQGHAAFGFSVAGLNDRVNAGTNGRLVGDTLGTTQAIALYTASSTAYNPPADPGPPRRWGDYSYTSLDPKDDMTMWTIQQFCNAANSYAVSIVKLSAPPPATPSTGWAVPVSQPAVNAPIVGTSTAGSGFYDPGANPAPPHTTFNHISAVVNGAGAPTVNSVTYTDPTHITLSLNTVGASAGTYAVTITNPDGQQATSGLGRPNGGITIGPSAAPANVSGRITDPSGMPIGGATVGLSGGVNHTTITDDAGNYHFDNLDTGNFYTVTPSLANYHFSPASRSFSLVGNMADAAFTATADASQSANAIDSAEYFVRQQYLDFLGREPDQGGFDYWTSQFTQCSGNAACILQKRIDVSAAFFMSGEFQETGSYVYDMYAGLLGRTPGYGEFTPDRAQVVGGSGLDAAKTAFAQNFVQRSEFTSRYPAGLTREQFVDAVLQTMQQRSGVDLSSQRAGLLTDYDNGGRPIVARHAAELALFASAEYNRAFVLMEYFGYLRRGEDTNGYQFWLNVLNQGSANNYRGMVCSFLTSTEYQHRFSSVVTHNNGECQ